MSNRVTPAILALSILALYASSALGALGLGGLPPVNQPPIATAGPDQSVLIDNAPLGVQLSATAIDPEGDPIVAWIWSINSQPSGSMTSFSPDAFRQNPRFITDTLGAYHLSVKACDPFGCSLPSPLTVNVVANQPPVAVAVSDITIGQAPLSVNFDGSQSYDPEGDVLTYVWNFGDGSVNGSGVAVPHTFTVPGTYTVKLGVTDSLGASAIDTLLMTVTSPINNPPTANVTATPNTGTAPLTVVLSANASDPEGAPLTYNWNFGDPASTNNSSAAANPTHTYNNAGTYAASVTVSDGPNLVTSSATIVVDNAVTPSLAFDITSVKLKTKKHGTNSLLQIKSTLNSVYPLPTDVITLIFDDREVFSAPFTDFILAGADDEEDDRDEDGDDDDTNAYKYKAKIGKARVEFDIAKGRICVEAKHIDLADFDDSQSVVVELHIGNSVDVDDVTFDNHGDDHEYKHP